MSKVRILSISGIIIACLVAFLAYSSVDNSLSLADKEYIPKFLYEIKPLPDNPTYEDELNYIAAVQKSVLTIAPGNDGVPFGQLREPRELYSQRSGLCYDRSRVIEKVLRFSGFKTRHVSIYSTKETGSAIQSLVKPGVASHAVTEVLTGKGWLVVDSNESFVSIDKNKKPLSISDLQGSANDNLPVQLYKNAETTIYEQPFTFVFGLYSRHGDFYPPYNFIPDINYGEFIANML